MIYVTGDCHQDFEKFSTRNFPEQKQLTKEDYVIVCGDFGGVWSIIKESAEEACLLDWLNEKPFTTLFVDGNHENFDRLYSYPEEEWHGGKIHKIRPSIFHLMRGQVYEIDGKKIFAFGGARSHDIDGGILEITDPYFKLKQRRLEQDWIPYRVNHISWWKEELASKKEMEEGRKSLAVHHNTVDYIVTHCCASSILHAMSRGRYQADVETDYLEEIRQNTKYTKWYFGHYHGDQEVTEKETLLYKKIIKCVVKPLASAMGI